MEKNRRRKGRGRLGRTGGENDSKGARDEELGRTKPSLEGSAFDDAEASPGFLFWRAFNAWNRGLREELEKIGLTQAQYSILAAVSYLGSAAEVVSQQDVSNQLSMDKMMVSDVTKTLEKKGMLRRNSHPYDGRAVALQLTSEARRALKVAIPLVEAIDESYFGKLGPDKLKALKRYLIDLAAVT